MRRNHMSPRQARRHRLNRSALPLREPGLRAKSVRPIIGRSACGSWVPSSPDAATGLLACRKFDS